MYYSCILLYIEVYILFPKVPRENVLYRVCEGVVYMICEKLLKNGKNRVDFCLWLCYTVVNKYIEKKSTLINIVCMRNG